MALRGVKPEMVEKRLKMFLYGAAGSGKTTASISFPNCYIIDTEKGSSNKSYVELIKKNNGAIFQTTDFNEVVTEVKTLLSEKHHYTTLIIDPVTVLYNDLVDHYASKGNDATSFGRHYVEANKQFKKLLQLLMRLDLNLILTAHSKSEYGKDMVKIGETFDAYKKLDYLFDLVIEIKKIGLKRYGIVKKTRISTFEEAGEFEFNYETIADKYGRDIIERKAVSESLAAPMQVTELKRLIALLKVPEAVTDKWLSKSNSSSFGDMSSDVINKCIENLNRQINGGEHV